MFSAGWAKAETKGPTTEANPIPKEKKPYNLDMLLLVVTSLINDLQTGVFPAKNPLISLIVKAYLNDLQRPRASEDIIWTESPIRITGFLPILSESELLSLFYHIIQAKDCIKRNPPSKYPE